MCNHSVTTNVEAIRAFVRDMHVNEMIIGNMPPMTGVFPDYLAPIVRNFEDRREYIEERGAPSSAADLEDHSCIVGYRRGKPLGWWLTVDGSDKLVQAPPTFELGDGDAIVAAAKAGMGICQMPISIVRGELERGELVTVLTDICQHEIEVHAVWPQTSHLSPKIRHVVDRLVEFSSIGRLD